MQVNDDRIMLVAEKDINALALKHRKLVEQAMKLDNLDLSQFTADVYITGLKRGMKLAAEVDDYVSDEVSDENDSQKSDRGKNNS